MVSEQPGNDDEGSGESAAREELRKTRGKIKKGPDKTAKGFDEGVVDLLSWVLDTETRAKIYIYLRESPRSTSDEIANGTSLYPSTVREALAELHEEARVERGKRDSDRAGNNPYEYEAIAPSELVKRIVGQVQLELNAVVNLDQRLGMSDEQASSPVTISVDDNAAQSDDTHTQSTADKETPETPGNERQDSGQSDTN